LNILTKQQIPKWPMYCFALVIFDMLDVPKTPTARSDCTTALRFVESYGPKGKGGRVISVNLARELSKTHGSYKPNRNRPICVGQV
jgi:hypothetical protein